MQQFFKWLKTNASSIYFFILIFPLLVTMLIWRFQLGQTRFFDVDEFAHMHWGHNAFLGYKPYIDFFYFFPPLFLYILWPVFKVIGSDTPALLAARALSFWTFIVALIGLFLLIREVRGFKTALFTLFILSFLPVPLDKWMEIRPDSLAVAATLFGMFFLIKLIKTRNKMYALLAGFFYSLGVMILPKVILYTIIGLISFLFWERKGIFNFIKTLQFRYVSSTFRNFFAGFFIPVIIVLFILASYGDIGRAIYLTTTISTNASKVLGSKFPLHPSFVFSPNDVYYGAPGKSLPWHMNLYIWIIGVIGGILTFVSFLDGEKSEERYFKFLVSASFLFNHIAYIKFLPLKHEQYLIAPSPMLAYFAACALLIGWNTSFGKIKKFILRFIMPLALVVILFEASRQYFVWKLKWYNQALWSIDELHKKYVPPNEAVYDLTGETVFYKEGYYFCCIPYGQYEEALTFSYPNIETSLRKNQVRYIHIQEFGRLVVLPSYHQKIIKQYYVLSPDHRFMVSGVQLDFNDDASREKDIDLIASGVYEFLWNSSPVPVETLRRLVSIDGKVVEDNPIMLSEGIHKVKVYEKGILVIRQQLYKGG